MRALLPVLAVLLPAAAAAAPIAVTPLAPIALAVGDDAGPQSLALADVSGDGVADLLVVDREDDALHVLLGVGDGTFRAPVDYPLEGTPTAVTAADVASPFASDTAGDIDGKVDVIVAHEDGFAEILLGRGDGSFDPPEQDLSEVLDSLEVIGVAVRDLDGNQRPDLIFLDGFDEVYFLCNAGGVFAPCATDYVCTEGGGAVAFAVTDLDADGDDDVAVASADSQDLRVIPGLGGGAFDGEAVRVTSAVTDPAQRPAAMVCASLDDVGGEELVVANAGQPAIALSVFTAVDGLLQGSVAPGVGDPRALAVADLDGDTIPDLVTAQAATPGLAVARGDGSAGFGAPLTPSGGAAIGAARAVVAGPIDADGHPDLAVLSAAGDAVLIALTSPTLACAGDCNGDGSVVINELLLGVNIAIGLLPVGQCPAFDTNASSSVEINELIAAVRNALEGCSSARAR